MMITISIVPAISKRGNMLPRSVVSATLFHSPHDQRYQHLTVIHHFGTSAGECHAQHEYGHIATMITDEPSVWHVVYLVAWRQYPAEPTANGQRISPQQYRLPPAGGPLP